MTSQANQWYLSRNGEQHGPFSDADLANFAALGQLQTNDLVWREGFSNWRPARTIFPESQRAPVPASPIASKPVRPRADASRREETPQQTSAGPTWRVALIALVCSALIGGASGYAFKHFATNSTLTPRDGPK
jgi:hypothetical protein